MGDDNEGEAFARNSDPQTSHDAADIVDATKLEAIVVEALATHGDMTSVEVAQRVRLDPWSVSPRFAPLERKGLIERTGERRRNDGKGKGCNVWRIKAKTEVTA